MLTLLSIVVDSRNIILDHWRNDTDRRNQITQTAAYSSATLSATNPTKISVGSKPSLSGDIPETNNSWNHYVVCDRPMLNWNKNWTIFTKFAGKLCHWNTFHSLRFTFLKISNNNVTDRRTFDARTTLTPVQIWPLNYET